MESHYKYKLGQQLAQFKNQFKVDGNNGDKLIDDNNKKMNLKIICTDGEFYCHKKILLSSSNFFKQMNDIFNGVHEFDCSTGEIKCNVKCMKSILLVLYGEKFPTIQIKFKCHNIANDPIKLHMQMAYMMDMLDFNCHIKNGIFEKIMSVTVLYFSISKFKKPLVINYDGRYYDILSSEQLYMVKGLSFKSIYNIVKPYNMHKNRYAKYIRHILLFVSVNYYSESIITKYCREGQYCSKMLKKSEIAENDDIDEDIKDEYLLIFYIYEQTMR